MYRGRVAQTILVGMDFLRRFERALVVSRQLGVFLMDEGVIETLQQSLADDSQTEQDTDK